MPPGKLIVKVAVYSLPHIVTSIEDATYVDLADTYVYTIIMVLKNQYLARVEESNG